MGHHQHLEFTKHAGGSNRCKTSSATLKSFSHARGTSHHAYIATRIIDAVPTSGNPCLYIITGHWTHGSSRPSKMSSIAEVWSMRHLEIFLTWLFYSDATTSKRLALRHPATYLSLLSGAKQRRRMRRTRCFSEETSSSDQEASANGWRKSCAMSTTTAEA
jgi:hypothetical protein